MELVTTFMNGMSLELLSERRSQGMKPPATTLGKHGLVSTAQHTQALHSGALRMPHRLDSRPYRAGLLSGL